MGSAAVGAGLASLSLTSRHLASEVGAGFVLGLGGAPSISRRLRLFPNASKTPNEPSGSCGSMRSRWPASAEDRLSSTCLPTIRNTNRANFRLRLRLGFHASYRLRPGVAAACSRRPRIGNLDRLASKSSGISRLVSDRDGSSRRLRVHVDFIFQSSFARRNGVDPKPFYATYTATVVLSRVLSARAVAKMNQNILTLSLLFAMGAGLAVALVQGKCPVLYASSAVLLGLGYGLVYAVIQSRMINDAPHSLRSAAMTLFVFFLTS